MLHTKTSYALAVQAITSVHQFELSYFGSKGRTKHDKNKQAHIQL